MTKEEIDKYYDYARMNGKWMHLMVLKKIIEDCFNKPNMHWNNDEELKATYENWLMITPLSRAISIINRQNAMETSMLKGENLRRTLFAFLKANNAFYNYMNAFYNCHYLRCKEFKANPSFGYFFDFCSYKDDPTALIYDAFNWSDTKEGNSYWRSLYNKFKLFCIKLEEEESKKNIEEMKKELGLSFAYDTNTYFEY